MTRFQKVKDKDVTILNDTKPLFSKEGKYYINNNKKYIEIQHYPGNNPMVKVDIKPIQQSQKGGMKKEKIYYGDKYEMEKLKKMERKSCIERYELGIDVQEDCNQYIK